MSVEGGSMAYAWQRLLSRWCRRDGLCGWDPAVTLLHLSVVRVMSCAR